MSLLGPISVIAFGWLAGVAAGVLLNLKPSNVFIFALLSSSAFVTVFLLFQAQ